MICFQDGQTLKNLGYVIKELNNQEQMGPIFLIPRDHDCLDLTVGEPTSPTHLSCIGFRELPTSGFEIFRLSVLQEEHESIKDQRRYVLDHIYRGLHTPISTCVYTELENLV